MTLEGQKRRLLDLLAQSRADTRVILEGTDLEIRVYPDSGWRVRDIIGHIATWDRPVAKSLHAYRVGKEYALSDHNEAAFNEQEVLSQQGLTARQVIREWEQAREEFKEAVEEFPLERFSGDPLFPWGDERGTIANLVKQMVEHDAEHRDEITQAIQLSSGDR